MAWEDVPVYINDPTSAVTIFHNGSQYQVDILDQLSNKDLSDAAKNLGINAYCREEAIRHIRTQRDGISDSNNCLAAIGISSAMFIVALMLCFMVYELVRMS